MKKPKYSTNQLRKQGFSERSIAEYKQWMQVEPKKKTVTKSKKKAKTAYQKYLESDYWASVKLDLYHIRGKRCEVCFSTSSVQVHHKTYKRIGKEEPKDLILLCASCHKKAHKLQ